MINRLSKNLVALWIVHPLSSLIYALKYIRSDKAFPALILFSFFFGLSFVIPENNAGSADSARYAAELEKFHREGIGFFDIVTNAYSAESRTLDLYQPILTWFVSLFTRDAKWLFAIFALIFGWFWFKSIQILARCTPKRIMGTLLLLYLIFALINPIWSINGVRMWTAVQIFIYGIFLIYLKLDKRGYLLCFLSIFIHFSLIATIPFLLIFHFIPKKAYIFFYLFITSFFMGALDIDLIRDYFAQMPEFLQSRSEYLGEEYVENFNTAKAVDFGYAWHVLLAKDIEKYLILFTAIAIYFSLLRSKRIEQHYGHTDRKYLLYCLSLLFATFSNLLLNLPSGSRFTILSNSLILGVFILYFAEGHIKSSFSRLLTFGTPAMIFLIIFKLRVGFDFTGLMLLFGNPLIAFIFSDSVPIIEFVKSIF